MYELTSVKDSGHVALSTSEAHPVHSSHQPSSAHRAKWDTFYENQSISVSIKHRKQIRTFCGQFQEKPIAVERTVGQEVHFIFNLSPFTQVTLSSLWKFKKTSTFHSSAQDTTSQLDTDRPLCSGQVPGYFELRTWKHFNYLFTVHYFFIPFLFICPH